MRSLLNVTLAASLMGNKGVSFLSRIFKEHNELSQRYAEI